MTESPKYQVLEKDNNKEIRLYAGYIKAEVEVEGSNYKNAVENGFRILAGFIFGNNISRQKIDMTTPVQASQKIAMTTPVTVSGENSYRVAFIMPSEYTLETLPTPRDNRVHFFITPEQKIAAIRFSGYFQKSSIQQNMARLRSWIQERNLQPEGEVIVAGYNPPWIPGFLARNEIHIPIK